MINWKKLLETTISVGVAVAASVIGDRFVAKAANSIVKKDEETEKPNEVVEEKTEETEEKTDEEVEEDTED